MDLFQPLPLANESTVINVVIKSKDSRCITSEVPIKARLCQTWREVLSTPGIFLNASEIFDANLHLLTTTKKTTLEISSRVLFFYRLYSKHMKKYIVYIQKKPVEIRSRNQRSLSARSREIESSFTSSSDSNGNTNNGEHHYNFVEPQQPSTSSSRTNFRGVLPVRNDDGNSTIPVLNMHMMENRDTRFTADGDDDTQQGNIPNENEDNIRDKVLLWFQNRCNNSDMLRIRQEVRTAQEQDSLGLVRLLPFTGGVLAKAFLNPHS